MCPTLRADSLSGPGAHGLAEPGIICDDRVRGLRVRQSNTTGVTSPQFFTESSK